jgi:Putative adhesin
MTDPIEHHEFPCAGPLSCALRLGSGLVTVTTAEEHLASVDVQPYDGSEASRAAVASTTVKLRDHQLTIEAPDAHGGWIFRRGGRLRIDLRLPLDSTLRAHLGSADIHLDGQLSAATVNTGSGDIMLNRISGELTVHTGSGDLRADVVGGALRVETASGDARIGSVAGAAEVDSASGDVVIDEALDAVEVSTASGDAHIRAAHGNLVKVSTASGDVDVGVPAGTSVWLDLSTVSGTTRSDLEVSAAKPDSGPQLAVRVNTASGDIAVHRVGSPAAGYQT